MKPSTFHFSLRGGVLCSLFLFYLFVIIAHFFAPQDYDATRYYLSDLAAQNVDEPCKILMTIGFCMFVIVMLVSTSIAFEMGVIPLWLVFMSYLSLFFLYAMALVSNDYEVYSAMGLSYSQLQTDLHWIFVSIATALLLVIILAHAWCAKNKKVHWFFFICIVVSLLVVMCLPRDYGGLYQRIIIIVGTIWLALGFGVLE